MPKHSKKPVTPAAVPADPRYPIGKFVLPAAITAKDINIAIEIIAEMPKKLEHALHKLSDKKLDTPYREGGWSVRTLVHHIADSHAIAFERLRKALTENEQQLFAALPDSAAPVEWSVAILEGVHARWVLLMRSMTEEQFARRYNHMTRGMQTLAYATLLYAWHAQHHVAHITALRKRKGW
jgi:uncharacterized damage-inducible protein DinB